VAALCRFFEKVGDRFMPVFQKSGRFVPVFEKVDAIEF
jgi:hypothetical protein